MVFVISFVGVISLSDENERHGLQKNHCGHQHEKSRSMFESQCVVLVEIF